MNRERDVWVLENVNNRREGPTVILIYWLQHISSLLTVLMLRTVNVEVLEEAVKLCQLLLTPRLRRVAFLSRLEVITLVL
jgi:hypothetical protein